MKKTAGSMLADLLRAREKGASPKELEKKKRALLEQTKKQLSGPNTKVVNVSVEIRE